MNTSVEYLTESNLNKILLHVFLNEKIIKQYLFNYIKIDFYIELTKYNNIFNILPEFESNDTIKLLIEFDGFHHYTKNSQCVKDIRNGLGNIFWKKINTNTYGIRIPYFIQLDEYFSKKIFNVEYKLNNFPHGFITKKCVTPSEFCYYGDLRFIKEIDSIPYDIGNSIYLNLLNRYNYPKKSEESMSKIVSEFLIKKFDTNFYNDYKNGKIEDINDPRYRMLFFNDKYKNIINLL